MSLTDDVPSLSRGLAAMMAASASFAAMAICVSATHRLAPEVGTFAISTVRAVVNLAVLAVLVRGDLRALVGDARPALWVRGVLGASALLCHFHALGHIGAGEAAFLNQTSAAWVAVLAPLWLGERTRGWVWVAVAGSLVGMALLAHPRPELGDLTARWIGLSSGLFAAVAYVSIRTASATNRPTTIVFWFTWIAAVAAGLGAWLVDAAWPSTPAVWALAVGSGVFATLGQLFMTTAYKLAPAAPIAAASAASPLMTAVLAALLLDQVPDATGLAGMAVLLTSAVALPWMQTRR
ncbi:MAG: DMT family transporter [Alphaproteobacteria bacterium]|nr:DMT family transporter [Alphaproteobacteria bacterium]